MRRRTLTATLALVLSAGVVACGGGSHGTPATTSATPGPSATSSAAARGAAVWTSQCTRCHAPDPAGVGVAHAATVRNVVENGTDGMPAFAGTLSAEDITAVSDYVAAAGQ